MCYHRGKICRQGFQLTKGHFQNGTPNQEGLEAGQVHGRRRMPSQGPLPLRHRPRPLLLLQPGWCHCLRPASSKPANESPPTSKPNAQQAKSSPSKPSSAYSSMATTHQASAWRRRCLRRGSSSACGRSGMTRRPVRRSSMSRAALQLSQHLVKNDGVRASLRLGRGFGFVVFAAAGAAVPHSLQLLRLIP